MRASLATRRYAALAQAARLISVAIVVLVSVANAAVADQSGTLVKREILAMYDSAREPTPRDTRTHKFAELPLNHLGYVLTYHDLNQPLPDPRTAGRYAGVIVWLTGELARPETYYRWATSMAATGIQFILLDSLGAGESSPWQGVMNVFLRHLGVRVTGEWVNAVAGVEVATSHRALYEYERQLDVSIPSFPVVVAIDPKLTAVLQLRAPSRDGGAVSTLAAVGRGGGFAVSNTAMFYDKDANRLVWLINPFAFFAAALGTPFAPVPDVTTVSGRRLYFSHVDGDGWNNGVEMEPHRKLGRVAAELMLSELIVPYADLPVTVGLVAADVDLNEGGSSKTGDVARAIFALPQVEVGSHTCTHPFDWYFYERYDRAAEEKKMRMAGARGATAFLGNLRRIIGIGVEPTDVADPISLPRAYLRHPFDLGIEVDRAVRDTEALAPSGRRVMIYQWSGDTRPFEAVIRQTRQAGLRNINGGDTRYDAGNPSVAYVAPIGSSVGRERQIYAVNSNENTYTNLWTGPFDGFERLSETLDRTERPLRLKGFNLYYHTYSAEKQASLDVVKRHLDAARRARLAPVAASHYAAIADGYFETTIHDLGEGRWSVTNRGALQTVRLDAANARAVDLTRSTGVIGASRHFGALYVALDAAVASAVVAVTDADAMDRAPAYGPRAYLADSRWRVERLTISGRCSLGFTAQGYGTGEFGWRGLSSGLYTVEVRRAGALVWTTTELAREGRLDLALPIDAIEPVDILMSCGLPGDANTAAGGRN